MVFLLPGVHERSIVGLEIWKNLKKRSLSFPEWTKSLTQINEKTQQIYIFFARSMIIVYWSDFKFFLEKTSYFLRISVCQPMLKSIQSNDACMMYVCTHSTIASPLRLGVFALGRRPLHGGHILGKDDLRFVVALDPQSHLVQCASIHCKTKQNLWAFLNFHRVWNGYFRALLTQFRAWFCWHKCNSTRLLVWSHNYGMRTTEPCSLCPLLDTTCCYWKMTIE